MEIKCLPKALFPHFFLCGWILHLFLPNFVVSNCFNSYYLVSSLQLPYGLGIDEGWKLCVLRYTTQALTNLGDARPIVLRPTDLPVAAGYDRAWVQTQSLWWHSWRCSTVPLTTAPPGSLPPFHILLCYSRNLKWIKLRLCHWPTHITP